VRRAAFALASVMEVACGSRVTPSNTKQPEAGISISLYRSGDTSCGVVDDRRWVEITGSKILLPNIDPGASLASLVLETASPDVRIGPCSRARLPDARDLPTEASSAAAASAAAERARLERTRFPRANGRVREFDDRPRRYRRPVPARPEQVTPGERFAPIVQCEVAGTPGKYLVRILYVSSTLGYRVQHDIEIRDPTKATIESRFAIQTPHWRERAEIVVFDGLPGGIEPPREIKRGPATLDGGTTVLVTGPLEVPALLRRIFEGAPFHDDEESYDLDVASVWATLELPGIKLVPGPIRAHVELDGEDRYIDIPMQRSERFMDPEAPAARAEKSGDDEPFRIKLWIDGDLRGARQRMIVDNDGVRMVEVVSLTMSNSGDTPREVWLEEHARPAKRRLIDRAWPRKPSASKDTIRNKVVVKPGRAERVGYTIVYEM
jgi:hypothetical protein